MARKLTDAEKNADFLIWGLRGDQSLQKVLAELPEKFRKRIARRVLMENGERIKMIMATHAPQSTGYTASRRRAQGHPPLWKCMAINLTTKASKARGGTRVRIGAIYPDAAQAHLTDQGTAQRFAKGDKRLRGLGVVSRVKSQGLFRGAVKGTHWVERAWRSVVTSVLPSIEVGLVQGILKEANRLRRKHEKEQA